MQRKLSRVPNFLLSTSGQYNSDDVLDNCAPLKKKISLSTNQKAIVKGHYSSL